MKFQAEYFEKWNQFSYRKENSKKNYRMKNTFLGEFSSETKKFRLGNKIKL